MPALELPVPGAGRGVLPAAAAAALPLLAQTEMQLVTWRRDVPYLLGWWRSVELFVPPLAAIAIFVPAEDEAVMRAALVPPRSLGYPVHVVKMAQNASDRFDTSCEGVPGRQRPQVGIGRAGYIDQQLWNLRGDELSPSRAKYIMFVDSDAMFTSWGWIVGCAFRVGRPSWKVIPYAAMSPVYLRYKPIIDTLLGVDNQHEYMTKLPTLVRRDTLRDLRAHVLQRASNQGAWQREGNRAATLSLESVVQHAMCTAERADAALSNFNLMGAFAWFFANETFSWSKGLMSCQHVKHKGHFKNPSLHNGDGDYLREQVEELSRNVGCTHWSCSSLDGEARFAVRGEKSST